MDRGVEVARAGGGKRAHAREAWSVRRNLRILFNPPSTNFEHIDGLRGFASQWMIAYHVVFYVGMFAPARFMDHYDRLVRSPVLRFVEHGQVGLDIFFAISGFLIAHLLLFEHAKEGRISIRRFYIRRAFRLLPAYYLSLLIYCLVIRVNWDTVWANLVYANNFVPVLRQCMTWAWSLAIEEQFYIVFPAFLILLLRMKRHRLLVFAGLFVVALIIPLVIVLREGFALPMHFHPRLADDPDIYHRYFDAIYDKPYTRYGGLLCGVLVAYLYNHTGFIGWFSRLRFASLIGLVVLSTCGAVLLLPDLYFTPWNEAASLAYLTGGRLLFAASTAGIIVVCLSSTVFGRILNRILSAKFWYPIAQLSYSVYLLHPMVIIVCYVTWLRPRAPDLGTLVVYFVIVATISHLLALLMYLGLERPMMNLRKHPRVLRWEGREPAREAPAPARAITTE